jgi:enamine deaminase RidA (YjgF/YER057c/UK114 family)
MTVAIAWISGKTLCRGRGATDRQPSFNRYDVSTAKEPAALIRCDVTQSQNARETAVTANIRFLNPTTLSKPPGYTHVVEITGPGRTVYIAGQLGLDAAGHLAADARGQIVQAFENLKVALDSVGASFNEVVKINNYLTDMSHLPIFREVRDKYLNTKAPPASTTIAIAQLARDGAVFEIEAIVALSA